MIYSNSRQRFTGSLEFVLNGNTNAWIPDLMPDIDGYLEALRQGSFAGLAYCREHAMRSGRSLWGFKYPGWQPHLIRMLVDAVPETRLIYIFRNLHDCVRSAKAWGEIRDESETQQFCMQWASHMKFMQQWQHSHQALMLSYEALVKEPEQSIETLCSFLPFEGLSSGVLQHKINNLMEGKDSRRDHNHYIEPATLTPTETTIIEMALAAIGPQQALLP